MNSEARQPEFSLFCYRLATQAMVAMGEGPAAGEEEEPEVDLGAAKALIDTLEMLRRKTSGNLTEEEERVLGSLLYDLRMRYVERSRTR